jgi:hypothetical protein
MSRGCGIPNLKDLIGALDQSADVSFMLDRDLHLAYRNEAWNKFAVENDAPELASGNVIGTDLRRVVGRDLLPFYTGAFDKVERERAAWECLYECSSPALFRKFRMQIQILDTFGYLVRNSLVIERPHDSSSLPEGVEYLNADSIISMCMHCRCSRRTTPPFHWDFVPAHLERGVKNISHSLCPVCLEYFYPKVEE